MELLDLQPELLFMIFSYLDSRFLIKNVALVCKIFHNFIHGEYIWKKRIIPSSLFSLLEIHAINWKKVICTSDAESFRWKNNGCNMKKHVVKVESENSIYHVHLPKIENICVCSGTQDNSLKFWNLEKLTQPGIVNECDVQIHVEPNAHRTLQFGGNNLVVLRRRDKLWQYCIGGSVVVSEWITSIASYSSKLCTGSWDKILKVWDMKNGCQNIYSTTCTDEIIGLYVHENTVAACIQDRVKVFDVRGGLLPIQNTVTCGSNISQAYMDEKYIITSSDNENIVVHDRIANKILTTLSCANQIERISCDGERFLFGGDVGGAIHLWDMSTGKFEFIQTLDIGSNEPITGVLHTMGCFIVAHSPGDTQTARLEVFSLTFPFERWALFEYARFVSEFQYSHGVLALATYSDTVNIYTPE